MGLCPSSGDGLCTPAGVRTMGLSPSSGDGLGAPAGARTGPRPSAVLVERQAVGTGRSRAAFRPFRVRARPRRRQMNNAAGSGLIPGSTPSASTDSAPGSRTRAFWSALRAAAGGSRTRADRRRPSGWSAGRPGRRVPGPGSACLNPPAVLALRACGRHGQRLRPWAPCAGRQTRSRVGAGATRIMISHAFPADGAT